MPSRSSGRRLAAAILVFGLAGCATAPRGPVGTLADAGIATTSAFGSDVRAMSAQLDSVATLEVFARTYEICSNPVLSCPPTGIESPNVARRAALAGAVKQRAAALYALAGAYRALKADADYDARADLADATNHAIAGVNGFAAAVLAAGPAAPGAALISAPLGKIAGGIAGAIADGKQRRRLLAGSAALRPVVQRLRDTLAVEAFVFDSVAGYLSTNRTEVQKQLLGAGLVSQASIVATIADPVDMVPAADVDKVVAASPAASAALKAVLDAEAATALSARRARYQASLAALDSLIAAHDALLAGQPVNLADLDRLLGELVAALPAKEG